MEETKRSKRVVTKIGNIFCVEIHKEYKVYFQYIANDMTQKNSSVIRVFQRHYPIDYVANIEEIISDDVNFFAHTSLRIGILEGAWYKVGTHKNVGSTENIFFRLFDEGNFTYLTKSYRWYIWGINQKTTFVGEMEKKYLSYDMGWIYSYKNIVAKIETGEFIMKNLE